MVPKQDQETTLLSLVLRHKYFQLINISLKTDAIIHSYM